MGVPAVKSTGVQSSALLLFTEPSHQSGLALMRSWSPLFGPRNLPVNAKTPPEDAPNAGNGLNAADTTRQPID